MKFLIGDIVQINEEIQNEEYITCYEGEVGKITEINLRKRR